MKKYDWDRIRYSPVGKKWWRNFQGHILSLLGVCGAFFFMVLVLFILLGRYWWIALISYVGIVMLLFYYVCRNHFRSFAIISQMSESEFNDLLSEYKEYERKNLESFGMLTKYGMVLGDGIAPWQHIKQIEFLPIEYRYTRHGTQVIPPRMKVNLLFENNRRTVFTQTLTTSFDLADEIDKFVSRFSEFTDYKFEIDNKYYFNT